MHVFQTYYCAFETLCIESSDERAREIRMICTRTNASCFFILVTNINSTDILHLHQHNFFCIGLISRLDFDERWATIEVS